MYRIRFQASIFLMLFLPLVSYGQNYSGGIVRIQGISGGTKNGTGFINCSNNEIITAYHVIDGAKNIRLRINKKWYDNNEVIVKYMDAKSDLAILALNTRISVPCFNLDQNPNTTWAGAEISVSGIPLGFDNQLIYGRITQNGYLSSEKWYDSNNNQIFRVNKLNLIPLDITAEPGISGAPVIMNGRVIGVFSGSLKTGRGYSWAIPISYTTTNRINDINKPASRIDWSNSFQIVKEDLERSLVTPIKFAKSTLETRNKWHSFAVSTEDVFIKAKKLQYEMDFIYGPQVERINENLNSENASQSLNQLILILEYLLDHELVTASEKNINEWSVFISYFDIWVNQFITRTPNYPATRSNLIKNIELGNRFRDLHNSDDKSTEKIQEKVNRIFSNLLKIVASLDASQNKLDKAIKIIKVYYTMYDLVKLSASIDTMDDLRDDSNYYNSYIETIEEFEIYNWDDSHVNYLFNYQNKFKLVLNSGWLELDQKLKSSLFRQPQPWLEQVDLINMDHINYTLSKATCNIQWLGTIFFRPNLDNDGVFSKYWQFTNQRLRDIEVIENANLINIKKYNTVTKNGLLIEVTGELLTNNNKKVKHYLGVLFSNRGSALLNIYIPDLSTDYKFCHDLVDSLVFY